MRIFITREISEAAVNLLIKNGFEVMFTLKTNKSAKRN